MNIGTKIRAALTLIAILITVIFVIKHFSVLVLLGGLFIIGTEVANHWYNNDYTEAMSLATGRARQEKREKGVNYIGERFFDEGDE